MQTLSRTLEEHLSQQKGPQQGLSADPVSHSRGAFQRMVCGADCNTCSSYWVPDLVTGLCKGFGACLP